MGCIAQNVGIDATCSTTTPKSGLYLSQYVSTSEVEQYLTAQYPTANALIADKMAMAEALVKNSVVAHFNTAIRNNTVVASQRVGLTQRNRTIIPEIAGYWKGVEVELCADHGWYDFFLKDIDLFVDYTGAVEVHVFDLYTGADLATIEVDAVAGEVFTVDVSQLFASNDRRLHLFIGYESDGIDSYNTTFLASGCGTCTYDGYRANKYMTFHAVKIDQALPMKNSSLRSITDTGGLSLTYSLQCNTTDWLCKFSNLLAPAFIYKVAELIMDFAITNSYQRRNSANINIEALRDREAKYRENFDAQMKAVIGGVSVPNIPECFECRDAVRHVTRIP